MPLLPLPWFAVWWLLQDSIRLFVVTMPPVVVVLCITAFLMPFLPSPPCMYWCWTWLFIFWWSLVVLMDHYSINYSSDLVGLSWILFVIWTLLFAYYIDDVNAVKWIYSWWYYSGDYWRDIYSAGLTWHDPAWPLLASETERYLETYGALLYYWNGYYLAPVVGKPARPSDTSYPRLFDVVPTNNIRMRIRMIQNHCYYSQWYNALWVFLLTLLLMIVYY